MTPEQSVTLSQRLADSISLLIIHGILTDAERDRAYRRLDSWAKKAGLNRKGA